MVSGPYRVLPAGRGQAWLMQSLRLLRAQTARLLVIAVLMQILLSLVQVPLLGIFVVLAVPALTAGILDAFHRVGQGLAPGPTLLFAPLASGRHLVRFFAMGGLVIALSIICVSVVLGSTTEVDEALLIRIQQGDMAALEEIDPSFMMRLAAAFAISVAIGGTMTFFSIPLVWFRDFKLGSALGIGLKALLANWKPMLVLGLGLAAVLLPMFLLMMLFLQLTLFGPLIGILGLGVVMALLLLFQLLLFGTQYCSFREIFGLETAPVPEPPEDSGQLVA
jgi:hypothetical protein